MMFQLIAEPVGSQTQALDTSQSLTFVWFVLGLLVLIGLMVAIHLLIRAARRPELYGLTREKVQAMWKQIEQTSEQGVMGAKLAVIEADKLLDTALKSMMMPGETLGERLKAAQYKYPTIQQVWTAHKLRNQLVHDSAFELSVRQAKYALKDFERALKTLNVM